MKLKYLFIVAALACIVTPAHAWNCSNPLAERVVVPSGTAGTYGDGDGQLALYNGQIYECEVVPVNPPAPPASTSKSKSSSAANSAANSSSNSASSAVNNTSVVAKGGNATATGGNANQTQTQSQNQTANGGSANGSGNSSNSYTSTTNVPQQVASAYSPTVLPSAPCFKGYSGGAQAAFGGISFGGGKIDENCAELEAARQAPSLEARCKVYLLNKYVRKAGVTMEDCLSIPEPTITVEQGPATVIPEPTPTPAPVITINVPAPVVTIIPGPVVAPPPSIAAAARANATAAAAKVHHKGKPCPVVDNDTIKK